MMKIVEREEARKAAQEQAVSPSPAAAAPVAEPAS
jgi:hypothetical protein